jgi:hypothetical protein
MPTGNVPGSQTEEPMNEAPLHRHVVGRHGTRLSLGERRHRHNATLPAAPAPFS